MKQNRKLISVLLALALLTGLTAPALAAETASVIRLTKTTGTVEISKSSGKSVSLLKNMRLYNGYHVETSEESYAWINLDDSKLLKEDAESEVEVRKDGKKLEVQAVTGNLYFDVAEPLEDDESMNIRTSTMVVGIRGTSGWLEVVDRWTTRISVLEGVVECSVADPVTGQIKAEKIRGGETALCVVYPQERTGDKSDIIRDTYTVDDIPGFVLAELVRNIPLCDKIERETGLDIPRDLAAVAGGDPSGREPSGDVATPEVLSEADRREDEDEDALRKKLEELEKAQAKQENNISPDKILPKPTPSAPADSDDDSSDDSGSGSGGGTTTPEPPQTWGMKLKDVEVQALLADRTALSIPPNTNASDTTPKKNILEVDTGLTVTSGKTLTFQPGIDMEVYPGKTLQVDGTLTADNLQNDGTVTVTSGDTLRLRGNLTTAGTLNVTATGRIIVDGTFTRTGTLSLTSGAAVLAKTFAPNAAPDGWEVSATADANGYYTLIPSGTVTPPEPVTYTVTFNANGGTIGGDPTMEVTTGVNGIAPWPGEDPTLTGYYLDGWYDAPTGGNLITADHVFTADTTLYAQWLSEAFAWSWDDNSKTLTFSGKAPMPDYSTSTTNDRPWISHISEAKNIVVKDGITKIGDYAFQDCTALESITIPDSVTNIGESAFRGCSGLSSVTIPDSVTSMGHAVFYGCSGLSSVTIPDGVTSIGVSAFYGCSGLSSVTIPDGVTRIGNQAFRNCSGLSNVTIPDGVTSIEESAFAECTSLTSIIIPDSVTFIGGSAFKNCRNLSSVDIPEGVTYIGGSAFENCRNLSSVTIPSSVTFTFIGESTFSGCTSLTSVDIPEGVTSIGRWAFQNCTSLTDVTLPSSITSMAISVFSNCTSLKNVTIHPGATVIGEQAFNGCRGLTSVTIPDSVTSIGYGAFWFCSGLTSIIIPDSVASIERDTFSCCYSLTSVTIPSSVTSIGARAFYQCRSLTSITIPSSVTSIGDRAFEDCRSLTAINFTGTQAEWGTITIGTNALPSGITVTCTDGTTTT